MKTKSVGKKIDDRSDDEKEIDRYEILFISKQNYVIYLIYCIYYLF